MDNSKPLQEWFLDVAGTRKGPYSTAEIQHLIREGETAPDQRLTAAHLGGQWITVKDFLAMPHVAPAVTPQANFNAQFRPPPRRGNLNPPNAYVSVNEPTDPALSLFNTLQNARERKAAKLNPPTTGDWGAQAPKRKLSFKFKIPKNAVRVTTLGLMLMLAVWGLVTTVSKVAKKAQQGAASVIAAATPAPASSGVPLGSTPGTVPFRGTASAPVLPFAKNRLGNVPGASQADTDRERERRQRDLEEDREREEQARRDTASTRNDYNYNNPPNNAPLPTTNDSSGGFPPGVAQGGEPVPPPAPPPGDGPQAPGAF